MSLEDLTSAIQAEAEDIVNQSEIVVEELKAEAMKEDDAITKTIEQKKACILDSKNKSSSSNIFTPEYKRKEQKKESKEEEEKKQSGYYYGYNYGFSTQKEKTEDEKKKEAATSKVKAIFSENAERVSYEEDNQDIFSLYNKTIKAKSKCVPTKTGDSFKRGLLGALLDCAKSIMTKLESEE